jgi:hypothetical protein
MARCSIAAGRSEKETALRCARSPWCEKEHDGRTLELLTLQGVSLIIGCTAFGGVWLTTSQVQGFHTIAAKSLEWGEVAAMLMTSTPTGHVPPRPATTGMKAGTRLSYEPCHFTHHRKTGPRARRVAAGCRARRRWRGARAPLGAAAAARSTGGSIPVTGIPPLRASRDLPYRLCECLEHRSHAHGGPGADRSRPRGRVDADVTDVTLCSTVTLRL